MRHVCLVEVFRLCAGRFYSCDHWTTLHGIIDFNIITTVPCNLLLHPWTLNSLEDWLATCVRAVYAPVCVSLLRELGPSISCPSIKYRWFPQKTRCGMWLHCGCPIITSCIICSPLMSPKNSLRSSTDPSSGLHIRSSPHAWSIHTADGKVASALVVVSFSSMVLSSLSSSGSLTESVVEPPLSIALCCVSGGRDMGLKAIAVSVGVLCASGRARRRRLSRTWEPCGQ